MSKEIFKMTSRFVMYLDDLNLGEIHKLLIEKALEVSQFNQRRAAELLKVSPRVINHHITKYNFKHPNWYKNN